MHDESNGTAPADPSTQKATTPWSIYDVDTSDPASELVQRSGATRADIVQISRLMQAMVDLRAAEDEAAANARRCMNLNQTDMRAVQYLIATGNQGIMPTASALAQHLEVSTASVTKMLDRLEKDGHIQRRPHPTDRRALAIELSQDTRDSAMQRVGKTQGRRFYAAARLTPAEREVVIRFLTETADDLHGHSPPGSQ